MGDLAPFDFFFQESSSTDVEIRTQAIEKMSLIGALMGPEKCRSDMLPYLLTKMSDLDQVLLAIATKLEVFLPLVGGPDHANSLIALLEALCDAEEITVRNAAVSSVCKIVKQIGPGNKTQVQAFLEMFKRISSEELGDAFYMRVSSCSIISDLYSILNEADKAGLREIFSKLCKDELSIVRRAAARNFLAMAQLVDQDVLVNEMLPLMKVLIEDENQTIQVYAVEALSPVAVLLKKFNTTITLTNEVLPMVKLYADDQSWKIRQALSKKYGDFAKCFLEAEASSDIFPALMHLVLDSEPEVRSLAILEVFPFLEVVGTTLFIGEFAPVASQLVEDPMVNVRKLLAELLIDVAAKVGPEAVAMHLSDLVIKLMEDEDQMVRLRILKKIPVIAEEAPSLCTRLTEMFKAMFDSTNWRVRMELSNAMPAIIKHMGQEYFIDHFMNSFIPLLRDGVGEVRNACARAIPKMAAVSDINWIHESIFPHVRSMAKDEYLMRLSMVNALEGLLEIELPDPFLSEVTNLISTVTTDKVPNIRVRGAQAISHIINGHCLDSNNKNQFRPILSVLQNDADRDVKYFASISS